MATGIGKVAIDYQDLSETYHFEMQCFGARCDESACVLPTVMLLRNGDVSRLDPVTPPLADLLAAGDGRGFPGMTALDRSAPAQRFAGFAPRVLANELVSIGQPLVDYELEESDGAGRILRLSKSGLDLAITY